MTELTQHDPAAEATRSDQQLMAALAERDQAALDQLYARYAPDLYAVALQILHSPPDAQGLLTELFWEIWQKNKRFNPDRGSVRTYLVLLTRSRALDRLRSETTRRTHESQQREEQASRQQDVQLNVDPQRLAIRDEERQLVLAALAELTTAQQDAVQLSFFEGLTHREIAERLGQPLGTIKTHIRQGLIKLGQSLRIRIKP